MWRCRGVRMLGYGFFALYETTEVPADFMSNTNGNQGEQTRDPFDDTVA